MSVQQKKCQSALLNWALISTAVFILLLSACTEPVPPIQMQVIQSAQWDESNGTLHLSGHGTQNGSKVKVFNASSNKLIATTLISNEHYWKIDIQNLDTVPCEVRVENHDLSDTSTIKDAPTSCNETRTSRAVSFDRNVASNVDLLAVNLPNAIITSPASDVTIDAGSSVFFNATASGGASSSPLVYNWDFDKGTGKSTLQNPGAVTFTKPGIYHVTVTASNDAGVDPTPASRNVKVLPVSTSILAAPPVANIDSPPGPVTIMVGETVFFAGSAFDPSGSTLLTFLWNFSGAAPNSILQNPGPITFNQAGSYVVTLTVFDELGNRNIEPATVTIDVVTSTAASNQPPNGTILGPNTDVVIVSGSGLFFQGQGMDPDGNEPLTYFWNFAGAAPPNFQQNPGYIVFNDPGIFPVTLTVFDALGMADPTPETRMVTVLGEALNNNDLPDGMILTPDADVTINVGDALSFTASGNSPTGNLPLLFLWDFGDPTIPPSIDQNPMPVTFNTPGVFTVQMTVTDSLGQADPTPAELNVTVLDAAAPPSEGPKGEITSPTSDVTIEAGMAVDFQGDGEDAAGNYPITFLWNFGDPTIPDSIEQNPGPVDFNTPGVYTVTLLVTDSQGIVDPAPPTVVVTVVDPAGTPPQDTPPADTPPANPPPSGTAPLGGEPDGIILSPPGDVTITVGDTIELVGAGIDPNDSPLSFFWDIDGGPGNSTSPVPGNATFTEVGVWDIELTVTNAEGISDPTPARVTVTVNPQEPPPP